MRKIPSLKLRKASTYGISNRYYAEQVKTWHHHFKTSNPRVEVVLSLPDYRIKIRNKNSIQLRELVKSNRLFKMKKVIRNDGTTMYLFS